MKIRTDFVSNSSSSSFVFSTDFKKFSFEDFVKSVCTECDDGQNDSITYSENEAILKYCLKYFELLYLGRLCRGKKKQIIKRGYDYNGAKIDENNKEELEYSPFETYKRNYIDHKPEYDDEHALARMIDADTIEYEYDDFAPDNIVVLRKYMEDVVRKDIWLGSKKAKTVVARNERVAEIMKTVSAVEALESDVWRTPYGSETFLITMNTVKNTRDLIAAGYDIRLEKWENLDAIEARLRAGETVFHISCGDAGEGTDDMRLFSNGSQYPFKHVPIEQIRESW